MSFMAMQTTLKLRGTFLEVQDGTELMNCQMPRSLSPPCLQSASIEGDEADLGLVTSYVQNLSENLSCLNKDMAGCSRGSVGHPELCSRTCLYFATGTCANGSDCDYCHLAHPKRSVHLDKRRRDILRSMPLQEWATLVLPIVQQRIEAVDKSPESQAMLADIAARCGIPIDSMPAATPHRSLRLLVLTLRSMSLKALLSAMQRGLSQYGQQVEDMIEALLQHLRRLASEDVPLMQLVVR
mmetsp:Transcript_178852/g.567541  ORF Transcript_178852/g.567541 Transcript_178852/m.567541 type:complete len:240 (+) Transcript_178852:145-864(+)|eukprot:CAMPEP_0204219378 /NCGR_PEP_ID=MMETSP0361-20130328/80251_1 /ASSEMBLY_ACC=CAM_ASM_000343 /TAXON_ID=268821 /ORGANISM="Scrippsiella Hangoei, Strain SHTV-5" /LENGTH=239 /DNA_ID=CAMNT_0051184651 /DNA_START=114 /DNA_END=833 /DNA_ORIENTATION=-